MKNIVITVLAVTSLVIGHETYGKQITRIQGQGFAYSTQAPKPLMQLAAKSNSNRSAQPVRRGGRVFVFDPRRLMWYAYHNGRLVASGRASGGAHYCRDIGRSCRTPSGTYRIIQKGPANCRSSRYPKPHGGARMDYCMFFSRLYAIHGSNSVPGYNASHGCIRVSPSAARWLHGNFITIGTTVVVRSY